MSWREAASAALAGDAEAGHVMRGHRPPVLDAVALRATLLLALAAGLIAASAIFAGDVPFEPAPMLLRLVGLAVAARGLAMAATVVARLPAWSSAERWALVLMDEGLLLRSPDGEVAVERGQLLDVVDPDGGSGRRYAHIYLLLSPASGRTLLALPPVFESEPAVLLERLMRWRIVPEAPEAPAFPEPQRLASKLYDEAAAGKLSEGAVALRHGMRWLRRGPYAALLFAAVFLDVIVRLDFQVELGPIILACLGLCFAVPLAWLFAAGRRVRPRRGLAFVATPAELLIRTREGVLRAEWKMVERVRVEATPAWTLLDGAQPTRRLVIERADDAPIRYDEAYLSIPIDVARAMLDAYQRGLML